MAIFGGKKEDKEVVEAYKFATAFLNVQTLAASMPLTIKNINLVDPVLSDLVNERQKIIIALAVDYTFTTIMEPVIGERFNEVMGVWLNDKELNVFCIGSEHINKARKLGQLHQTDEAKYIAREIGNAIINLHNDSTHESAGYTLSNLLEADWLKMRLDLENSETTLESNINESAETGLDSNKIESEETEVLKQKDYVKFNRLLRLHPPTQDIWNKFIDLTEKNELANNNEYETRIKKAIEISEEEAQKEILSIEEEIKKLEEPYGIPELNKAFKQLKIDNAGAVKEFTEYVSDVGEDEACRYLEKTIETLMGEPQYVKELKHSANKIHGQLKYFVDGVMSEYESRGGSWQELKNQTFWPPLKKIVEKSKEPHLLDNISSAINWLKEKSGYIISIKVPTNILVPDSQKNNYYQIRYGVYLDRLNTTTLSEEQIINLAKFTFIHRETLNMDYTFEEIIKRFRKNEYVCESPEEFLIRHGFIKDK